MKIIHKIRDIIAIIMVMLIVFLIAFGQYTSKNQDKACKEIGYKEYKSNPSQCTKEGEHILVDITCYLNKCIATPYTLITGAKANETRQ